MVELEVEDGTAVGITAEMIRAQLELLVQDEVLRSSKRSVAFLRYVVEQTLNGSASQIKERTIGIEVFDRRPTYDTNADHIVRTAATELRKRLAIYYGDESHRSELRMGLVPGSYIPRFSLPTAHPAGTDSGSHRLAHEKHDPESDFELAVDSHPAVHAKSRHSRRIWVSVVCSLLLAAVGLGYFLLHRTTPQALFWKPVLDTPGPVLLAIGDVPNGPPTLPSTGPGAENATPIPRSDTSRTVPFGDAVTMARVVGILEAGGKKVIIRKETASSFSDLREGPVVLIGAFNNEWSLRLTRQLRFSLAMDAERHLIYIRDAQNPNARDWSWGTNLPTDHRGVAHGPVLQDYALISRIRNSETGKVVVVIGGLYTYGTQSAGEFLSDPQLMHAISKAAVLDPAHPNLQIVLGTTVTDEAPGPPRILAVSPE
jgi:hypothetical protein